MAIRIVFCYAHEDEELLEQLKAHLRLLERKQVIEMWYDRNISAGMVRQATVNEKLDTADIILLLISASFTASDYCYSNEMQRALELRKQGRAHVIPITLRPALLPEELLELQVLPADGVPVTDTRRWKSIDEALFNVTQGICLVLQKLAVQPQTATVKLLNPDQLQKVLEENGLLVKKEKPTREKYRTALHRDPRIAKVQIMSMRRPLSIADIYVRLRIHEEVSQEFVLNPLLQKAGKERDPNILLGKKHELLKTRATQALEPDEAIRKHRHCVIVGDPGSGKTTLLKYLALKSVDSMLSGLPALPIHIELNAFVSSKMANLLEFAAATWDERYGFSKDETLIFMQNELATGRAMLLLDALDETVIGESSQAAEASYKRVAEIITSLATRYHAAPIVVTARKAGYQLREPLVGFNELEVLDFSLDDMKRFVTNWFNNTSTQGGSNKATDLIARLERTLRIQELATNPLLLSLIVLVFERQLDLPDRRAALYKECVETLLTDWDSKRQLARRREFQPLHKRLLLEEIAWHFHQRSSRYFSERELLEVIAGFLPAIGLQPEDSKRILQEIANENGILKEQAHGWYGFIHMTLQEYCAARYLTDHNELETLMQYVDDPRWEEVVLLYAGQTSDASRLLERLLGKAADAPTDDIFRNNLITAGRCLAARPTIRRVELREEIISSLLTLLKTTFYSFTQHQVTVTLLELDDPKINKRLLNLLNDIKTQRSYFIQNLVWYGKAAIEPDILAMIKDEQYPPDLRRELIEKISSQAFVRDLPGLLAMIKDEQCPADLRCELIKKISLPDGGWGTGTSSMFNRVLPDLLALLKDKQCNPSVRIAIITTCQNTNNTSVAKLWEILRSEPAESIVYKKVLLTLGHLGEAVPASEVLLFLSHEQNIDAAREMCRLLVRLGDTRVMPDLLHTLKNRQVSLDARTEFVQVIYSLGKSSIVPELLSLLKDDRFDFYVRVEIARILVRERVIAMPALLSLSPNRELNIFLCSTTFEKLGGDWLSSEESAKVAKILAEIVPELLRLLKDKQLEASLREGIVLALGQKSRYWPTGTVQELLSILKNEPRGTLIYDRLILIIAEQKEPSGLQDALLQILKERRYPQKFNRFFNVINSLKDQKFVPDLLSLLTDWQQPYGLRSAVVSALESLIDDDETTAHLTSYVPRLYIDETIYGSLWRLSRRRGVKIPARNTWTWL